MKPGHGAPGCCVQYSVGLSVNLHDDYTVDHGWVDHPPELSRDPRPTADHDEGSSGGEAGWPVPWSGAGWVGYFRGLHCVIETSSGEYAGNTYGVLVMGLEKIPRVNWNWKCEIQVWDSI